MGARLALLALAVATLAACGTGEQAVEPAAPPASTSSGGETEIAGVGLDGEQISSGDFRGRPLLVNVWSSW